MHHIKLAIASVFGSQKFLSVHFFQWYKQNSKVEMKRLIENVMISWQIIATNSYKAN